MIRVRLVASASVALLALACGDRVLVFEPDPHCSGDGCGGGTEPSTAVQAGVGGGGRGAGGSFVPGPWPSDDDLDGVLERVEVPNEHDLICVACSRPVGDEQADLIAFSMERFSVIQPELSSTHLTSMNEGVLCTRPSFDVRDGFAYGCDTVQLWRADLLTGVTETVPIPCLAMEWVDDELWVVPDQAEAGEVERYASWAAVIEGEPEATLMLDLEAPIEQLDHEESQRVWTSHFGPGDLYSSFDLAEGTSALRTYQPEYASSPLGSFDALPANQTVFRGTSSGTLIVGVFSHQTGSVQAKAPFPQSVRGLRCWAR